jgi:hypothetical protein
MLGVAFARAYAQAQIGALKAKLVPHGAKLSRILGAFCPEEGVANLVVRFGETYRSVEAGLWPNGPGELSPGFTLGNAF